VKGCPLGFFQHRDGAIKSNLVRTKSEQKQMILHAKDITLLKSVTKG